MSVLPELTHIATDTGSEYSALRRLNHTAIPVLFRRFQEFRLLTSITGDAVSTAITPGCAGYATIGVFIALFALMMLDIRLPLKKAWYIFLFGLAGTWLQNILRIVVSIVAAYYWGRGALDIVHYNISYVIFPLWYALFAYVYLRQAGREARLLERGKGT
ncbi:exosortase/archaeosortase family protein [Chloroflexota bacterium]